MAGSKMVLSYFAEDRSLGRALARAIYIAPAVNLQIRISCWKLINNHVGERVSVTVKRWKTQPDDAWQAVTNLKAAWVAKIQRAITEGAADDPVRQPADVLREHFPKNEAFRKWVLKYHVDR